MQEEKKLRKRKSKNAVEYFKILAELVPEESHKALFYAAETYFVIGYYNSSVNLYHSSLESSIKMGNQEYKTKAIKGLLAAMGKPGITKKHEIVI